MNAETIFYAVLSATDLWFLWAISRAKMNGLRKVLLIYFTGVFCTHLLSMLYFAFITSHLFGVDIVRLLPIVSVSVFFALYLYKNYYKKNLY